MGTTCDVAKKNDDVILYGALTDRLATRVVRRYRIKGMELFICAGPDVVSVSEGWELSCRAWGWVLSVW